MENSGACLLTLHLRKHIMIAWRRWVHVYLVGEQSKRGRRVKAAYSGTLCCHGNCLCIESIEQRCLDFAHFPAFLFFLLFYLISFFQLALLFSVFLPVTCAHSGAHNCKVFAKTTQMDTFNQTPNTHTHKLTCQ